MARRLTVGSGVAIVIGVALGVGLGAWYRLLEGKGPGSFMPMAPAVVVGLAILILLVLAAAFLSIPKRTKALGRGAVTTAVALLLALPLGYVVGPKSQLPRDLPGTIALEITGEVPGSYSGSATCRTVENGDVILTIATPDIGTVGGALLSTELYWLDDEGTDAGIQLLLDGGPDLGGLVTILEVGANRWTGRAAFEGLIVDDLDPDPATGWTTASGTISWTCGSTPATSPEATPTTAPTAIPSPTMPPVPALLERTWQEGRLTGGAFAAVRTSEGWVAVGINCAGGCDSFDATAFTSPDGLTWTERLIENVQAFPLDLVRVGDHIVALGSEFTDRGDSAVGANAVIWESETGATWERISTIDLGVCDDVTCLDAQALSATSNGVLVLATIDRRGGVGRLLRSDDGRDWAEVDAAVFGSVNPAFRIIEAMATGSTSILAGACLGCPVSVWSSDDGIDWTLLGEAGFPTPSHIDMATDGTRLVLAHETCAVPFEDADEVCTMLLWTGELGGPFEQVATDIQVRRPHLAAVGDVFVLAGTSDAGARVYASTDGLTWAEQPTTVDVEFCIAWDLVSAGDELLLLTPDCVNVWLGRAQP